MADPLDMADLDLPSTLYDPSDGTEWHLSDPSVEVLVQMKEPDGDGGQTITETAVYPTDTIQMKVDRGDLQLPGDVETDDDPPERAFECDECGKTFDSEHGLQTHKGQQHGDGGDE